MPSTAFWPLVGLLALCGCPESHVLLGPDGGDVVPDEVILRPIGRVSGPGHNVAPKGSLLRAKNCTMRRPGALAEVPAPVVLTPDTGPAATSILQQSPQFDNGTQPEQLLVTGAFATTGVVKTSDPATGIQYEDVTGALADIEYFDHGDDLTTYPLWLARDNLYLADRVGTYKWSSTDDLELERIWDAQAFLVETALTVIGEVWLADGEHVKYKTVVVFEDGNSLTRRTNPSLYFHAENDSGVTRNVRTSVAVPDGDFYGSISSVEVYRSTTFPSTVEIPNEYYLVRSIDASDFSAHPDGAEFRVHEFVDETAQSDLGAALYTSQSQENVGGGNVVPPSGLYHAAFRGHEFFGDVADKEFFPEIRRLQGSDTGIHDVLDATYTLGSNSVTGVTDLDGAEVGMLLVLNPDFPYGTYILSITGSGPFTLTVSENALASNMASLVALDTVFVRWSDGSTSRFPAILEFGITTSPVLQSDLGNADIFSSRSQVVGDRIPWDFTIVVASKHRCARLGPSRVWISNPDQYDGNADWDDLDTGTGSPTSGGTPALPALHRRRIYWSKHQEPEHTTLLSFQDVGGPGNIVGLGALRDALIILKEEGVYRLTGNNGNWRIDPLDTSVRILGGRSTQVMGNAVYTLSDRGLLRITSTGVQNLTQNVVNDWFRETNEAGQSRLEEVRRYMTANDGYHPLGLFSAADPGNQEYVLNCDGELINSTGFSNSEMLVHNAATGAFTTWNLSEGGTQPIQSLGFARGDYTDVASVTQAPGITYGRPFSVADTSASLFLIDNRQQEKPSPYFEQELAFRGIHIGDPTHIKQWIELVWDFDSVDEGAPVDVAALYATHEAEAIQTGFQTQTIGAVSKQELRLWPPRSAVARSTKPVFGLRGRGLRVFGMRATYRSSGRKSPL